jgi:hypothetical protein
MFQNGRSKTIFKGDFQVPLIDLENGLLFQPDSFPMHFPSVPEKPSDSVQILAAQTYWSGWGSSLMKPWAHLPVDVKYINPRNEPTTAD